MTSKMLILNRTNNKKKDDDDGGMIESCRSDRCACRRFVGLDHAASALHKPDDPVQCTQWCVLNPQKSAILGCRTFPRRLNSTGDFF